VLSVFVFYLILSHYFKAEPVRLFGALLFATNGFFVGFGRIAQYQNLNLLFSFLSLLMFIKLNKSTKYHLMYAVLGTVFLCISILAHWDAIFFVLPIATLYLTFLLNREVSATNKIAITVACLSVGSAILLPYLIPYRHAQLENSENMQYFGKRVGLSTYPIEKHRFIFELYNPFLTFSFLSILAGLSMLTIKKSWMFWIWFVVNFLLIRYLMQKPGTHIYNYIIPSIFLSTYSINLLFSIKKLRIVTVLVAVFTLTFLYLQSYKIFVDHKQEYPWDKKTIFSFAGKAFETPEYTDSEVLTFGFPHFRNWENVNKFVLNDPDNCSYITNEGKEISQIYMTAGYGIKDSRKCYYVIVVKRPFITGARDAQYPEAIGKTPLYTYSNKETGEELVEVFKKNQKKKEED
jgi:hypothetical protein